MLIAGGFYALLTVVMLSATHITGVAANPQAGWTTLLENYGGVWLLGLGLTIIFAGSIGHIDGSVQAAVASCVRAGGASAEASAS